MTISEVSKTYQVSSSTLRYYEQIHLLPEVTRNEQGVRCFSARDLEWVEFIVCMRKAGLSIKKLREYVDLLHHGEHTADFRKKILLDQQAILDEKIEELEKTRTYLKNKIKKYESAVMPTEHTLQQ
jgi:DNA-binding transcriptional MerR regulator